MSVHYQRVAMLEKKWKKWKIIHSIDQSSLVYNCNSLLFIFVTHSQGMVTYPKVSSSRSLIP